MEISSKKYQKYIDKVSIIDKHLNLIEESTGGSSLFKRKLEHPSFLALVEMGDIITNYLFYLMFEKGSNWTILLLLNKIVKDKPEIPKEILGKFYEITVFWMNWYIKSDYYKNDNVYNNLI
jgi:hypothetical protein